mgnify:CR=1 FL=1
MAIAKVTSKGQMLIPVEYRRKFGIDTPGQVVVTEKEGHLIILPLPEDPIGGARGILQAKKPLSAAQRDYKESELAMEDNGHD